MESTLCTAASREYGLRRAMYRGFLHALCCMFRVAIVLNKVATGILECRIGLRLGLGG